MNALFAIISQSVKKMLQSLRFESFGSGFNSLRPNFRISWRHLVSRDWQLRALKLDENKTDFTGFVLVQIKPLNSPILIIKIPQKQ